MGFSDTDGDHSESCGHSSESNPTSFSKCLYKRVLLKLSGEVLMGNQGYGIEAATVSRIASEIIEAHKLGVEICIVIGGGNIFRGMSSAASGINRATADYMGMLATVMNALALQNEIESKGIETRVLSAIPMSVVCEPYIRRRAHRHLEKGRIVIFAAGSGSPFFTTDTAAALRASEMECDAILKGTKVCGIFSADPKKFSDAKFFESLSYKDVLDKELQVMDLSAITLAKSSSIPIIVFSIQGSGNFKGVLCGEGKFTKVGDV